MRDGHTRRIVRSEDRSDASEYFASHKVSLIIEKGPAAGEEFVLDREKTVIGRGPEADFRIRDESMSREHAALEMHEDGFRVRDLNSTNGVKVNGGDVVTANLKHGDSIELGNATLRFVLESVEKSGKTHWA